MNKSSLLSWGFQNSISYTSLFYTHKQGRVLLLLVYVDDILITGESQDDVQQVITDLHQEFALTTQGAVNYSLSFEVNSFSSGLHLSPFKYAKDLLQKTNMAEAKPCSTPMGLNNKLSLTDSEPFAHLALYRT